MIVVIRKYLHYFTHTVFNIRSKGKCNIWRQVIDPNALRYHLNRLLRHDTHVFLYLKLFTEKSTSNYLEYSLLQKAISCDLLKQYQYWRN